MLLALLLLVNEPHHSAMPSRQDHFEYVEDLTIQYTHLLGKAKYIGNLDAKGHFVPDLHFPPETNIRKGGNNVPLLPPLLYGQAGEKIYEYHAGRLVLGIIKTDVKNTMGPFYYYFYPDLDGKIIEMNDYLKDYDPAKSPRIYNLPGRIVKKSNAK